MPPKKAQDPVTKEAIVFVLDVGKESSKTLDGTGRSYFDDAKECMLEILQRKIFNSMPNDPNIDLALVLMGADYTDNTLNETLGGYESLAVACPFEKLNWTTMKLLKLETRPHNASGDFVEALILAMDLYVNRISSECDTSYHLLKIILLSKLCDPADGSFLGKLIERMVDIKVNVIVISDCIEFVQEEDSEQDEVPLSQIKFTLDDNKTETQRQNERLIVELINKVDGSLCNFTVAFRQLSVYKPNSTKSVAWNVDLEIGSTLRIKVSAYLSTKENAAFGKWETLDQDNNPTKATLTYYEGNRKVDNESEDIVKGVIYGSAIVPLDSVAKNDESLNVKSLKCLGFTEQKNIKRHLLFGDGASIVLPQKGSTVAEKTLCALIKAMISTRTAMICRHVYSKASTPKIKVLYPNTKYPYPSLTMIELIYSDNYYHMQFPSLKSKKTEVSEEQNAAMSNLIDAMDLTKCVDEYGDKYEAFEINELCNPALQYTYNCIGHRILNPKSDLPPIPDNLLEILKPPQQIMKKAKPHFDRIKELFPVEKIEKESKQKKTLEDTNKAQVNDNDDDVNKIEKVGTLQPSNDFRALLEKGEKFSTIAEQMGQIILDLLLLPLIVEHDKIREAITTYRTGAITKDVPHIYNDWITDFKQSVIKNGKVDFWISTVVSNYLGLISFSEHCSSSVDEEEAEEFYKHVDMLHDSQASDIDKLFDDL